MRTTISDLFFYWVKGGKEAQTLPSSLAWGMNKLDTEIKIRVQTCGNSFFLSPQHPKPRSSCECHAVSHKLNWLIFWYSVTPCSLLPMASLCCPNTRGAFWGVMWMFTLAALRQGMEEAWAHKARVGNVSPGCKTQHLVWADVMSFSFTAGSDLVSVPV